MNAQKDDHPVMLVAPRLTDPLMMPDNVVGKCERCGHAIQFRPDKANWPHKLCMECVHVAIDDGDEVEVVAGRAELQEAADFIRKRSEH